MLVEVEVDSTKMIGPLLNGPLLIGPLLERTRGPTAKANSCFSAPQPCKRTREQTAKANQFFSAM